MPLIDPVTMSTPTKGAVAPASKDGVLASLVPVQIKRTPASQTTRHALPAILGGAFALQFDSLVADPVSTMLRTLPIVAILQLSYVITCLPAAGSQTAKPARKARPGERKKGEGVGPNSPVAALLSLLLAVFAVPFLYFGFVCFGAPAYTFVPHTALCAAHLALLALLPLFYVHGVDGSAWAAVGSFRAPLDETFGGFVGGFVGAWLGAVPIPLDWDREWQRWPVTILSGVYGGYLLGRVLGGTVLWGKKFSS